MEHFHAGPQIKSMRKRAGVTQRELAARLGVALYQTVQKWENGQRALTLPQLAKIARVLGHSAEGSDKVKALFGIGAEGLAAQVEHLQHDLNHLREQIEQRGCGGSS